MYRIATACALIALLFLLPGCKGSSTPDTPTSTVTSITVSSTSSMLRVGQTETFTATANMSDGTTKAAAGTWSSDNPNAATVNSSGLVTIIGAGNANIVMSYGGKTGSKGIRGLPDYQGTYIDGTYIVVSCTCSGDFTGSCDSFPNGTSLPIEMNLMQTTDMVTGTIYLGSLSATMSGQIATDGGLVMTGQVSGTDPFTISVATAFYSTTPGHITGSLAQQWTATGYSGSMLLGASLNPLIRTTAAANEAGFATRPLMKNPTLEELKQGLRIR